MTLSPPLSAVLEHTGTENFVALNVSLQADMETPISVFQKLAADHPGSFLLESVEGGELMGRYSFMGCKIDERFEFKDGRGLMITGDQRHEIAVEDPLVLIRERLRGWRVWAPGNLPRFVGGTVGTLGFDCVRYFEDLPLPKGDGVGGPEGVLLFARELIVYDHLLHRITLIVHAPLTGDRRAAYQAGADRLHELAAKLHQTTLPPEPPWFSATTPSHEIPFRENRDRAAYEDAVRRAQESIEAGEVFQVVVSQRLTVEVEVEPFILYRALRALNPSPYMFFFRFEATSIVGASPEVLVRLEDGELLLRPIAGTRRRGRDGAEDRALETELLADEKELAEHRMLVDLGRNDLGRVAAVGSVKVERPMHIERYSHVMHIVTDVRARLAEGLDAMDVFRACFPAGTVSGAPKIRACELLAELEPDRRGIYAGAVGYFDTCGNMDMCIAIRTLVVEPGAVHIQAGAGIVHDSVPSREYEECHSKARAGLAAVRTAVARGEVQ